MLLFQNRHLKGSTLVFSLIVLAFLLVSALSLAVIAVSEKRAALSSAKSSLSFQAADGGAEAVLAAIKEGDAENTATPGTNVSINDFIDCNQGKVEGGNANNGTFEVTFYQDDTDNTLACSDDRLDVVRIVSKGTYAGTTRAIDVGIPPAPLAAP